MKRLVVIGLLLLVAMPAHARKERYKLMDNGTVQDRRTGLQWEMKCDECDPTDLHYINNCNLDWTEVYDWLDAVNAENYAGHDDWRIPTVNELVSILDYGRVNPAID